MKNKQEKYRTKLRNHVENKILIRYTPCMGVGLIEIIHQKGIEHASFKIKKFSFLIDPLHSAVKTNLNEKKKTEKTFPAFGK